MRISCIRVHSGGGERDAVELVREKVSQQNPIHPEETALLILRVNLTGGILEAIELFDTSHVDVIVGLLANQSLVAVVSVNTEASPIVIGLNPEEHLNNPT